jgi:tRNA (adenine-N(1)-)-methyltransferase non-catalytic subunit
MNVGDTVLLEMNGDKWAFIKLKRDGYVTSFPECHRRRMCPTRVLCAPRRRVRSPHPRTRRRRRRPSSTPSLLADPLAPSFPSFNRTAVIGKHKDVSLDPLIGAPFGSTYEVDMDGVLYPAEPDPPEWNVPEETIEAIDDERNNADVNDMRNNSAQGLDQNDIARLKREGKSGKEIVEMLSTNSATFAKKTAFAQEKYKKKKLRKHLVKCRARRPTARATCEAYFHKQPAATNYMRYDALGMLLALGNVGANAQPLVVETCGGLVVGACADRMGGAGVVCAGHTGAACNSLDIVRLMNLSDAERESIVTAPVTELMKARRRWESGEVRTDDVAKEKDEPMIEKKEEGGAEGGAEANTAVRTDVDKDGEGWTPKERPEGWRSKRIEAASADRIAELASPSEGFTSLIVASPALDPTSALTKLLPLLAPSAPFCVWSYTAQPLAEALDTLRRSSSAVNLSLQEPWLRKHQVLPRRTHPTMTTTAGSGGYVLSGNVIPEAERKRQRGDDDETAVKRARTGDS